MPGFDRRRHRIGEQRWFEDLRIGERFPIPSRTVMLFDKIALL
jgi:hypothetical protein